MTEILNKINKTSSVFYCQHILDSINNLSELCNFTASNDNGTGVIEYLKMHHYMRKMPIYLGLISLGIKRQMILLAIFR